jgi:hypothetical protein
MGKPFFGDKQALVVGGISVYPSPISRSVIPLVESRRGISTRGTRGSCGVIVAVVEMEVWWWR